MRVAVDLHNHSCLSPCGSLDNSPLAMATVAAERGITVMALTDHNTARNCPAFADACKRVGLVPLFGTETTSAEEVHVLSIFRNVDAAMEWGDIVYGHLPEVANDPDLVGDQPVVDVDEGIIEFEERFLLSAVDITLDEISRRTTELGGLCIPAHIDRSMNSIVSQLGFLPDTPFSALEVTRLPPAIETRGLPLICSSDAHYLDDIGRRTVTIDFDDEALTSETAFVGLERALTAGAVELSL